MSNALLERARRHQAGFGFGPDATWDNIDIGFPDTSQWPTDTSGGGSSGGGSSSPPWYAILQPTLLGAEKVALGIFGNQYQQPTYRSASQYQLAPSGYRYDSSGQLVAESVNNVTSFISKNFLLVSAGVIGVVLLFRTPPGRR